jgi:hypothetical protein
MNGPTPKTSVRVVPVARTAAVSLRLVSRIWSIGPPEVTEQVGDQFPAGLLDRIAWGDLLQQRGGGRDGDLFADAAGDPGIRQAD